MDFKKIKDMLKSHRGEAATYIVINIFGSLMPVWGGILLYILLSINFGFWTFVDNGQFYLFSAAFFTPSCYQLYKNKDSESTWHQIVFLFSIFLLIISAILFTGTSILNISKIDSISINNVPVKMNYYFLRWSSMILWLFSIIIAFVSQTIENKVRSGGPDAIAVSETRAKDLQELSVNFDIDGDE